MPVEMCGTCKLFEDKLVGRGTADSDVNVFAMKGYCEKDGTTVRVGGWCSEYLGEEETADAR